MDISVIDKFSQLKVIIVGDVMLDRYLKGTVNRISPEAPVPIVHWQSEENRLGGAANVALNVAALGANPYLASVVGQDENAALFLDLLPQNNLNTKGILSIENRQTTVKTRVLAGSQQVLRVDREDTHDLSDTEYTMLLESIKKLWTEIDFDVLILQDYNKGVLHPKLIHALISIAHKSQTPIIVDPKKRHFFEYQKVNLFKPNLKEVRENVPFEIQVSLKSLQKASDYLRERLQHQVTMITLSEKGVFVDDGKKQAIVPTQARNIADVCGAGDTVVSVAALTYALGLNMQQIAFLGNLAGGQVCEKIGVVSVNKGQLQEEFKKWA